MLVLTRKAGEVVMIGGDVEIRVLKVRGNEVSLGVVAPRELPVHRKEVYEEIARENEAAVSGGAGGGPDLARIAKVLPPRNGTPRRGSVPAGK